MPQSVRGQALTDRFPVARHTLRRASASVDTGARRGVYRAVDLRAAAAVAAPLLTEDVPLVQARVVPTDRIVARVERV